MVVVVITVLLSSNHDTIVEFMRPAGAKIRSWPGGWVSDCFSHNTPYGSVVLNMLHLVQLIPIVVLVSSFRHEHIVLSELMHWTFR